MTKKIIYMAAAFCIGIISTSCYTGRSLMVTPSDNNDTYKIDYLFEHDGCKVYRFYDMGNYVYFINCNGSMTAISNDSVKSRVETITKSNSH